MFNHLPRINIFSHHEEVYTTAATHIYPNYTSVEYTSPPGSRPPTETFIKRVNTTIRDTRPAYVLFKHQYRERLEDIVTRKSTMRTYIKYITYDPSRTYADGTNTFEDFVQRVLTDRLKAMYGEAYDTYTKTTVVGEEIDTETYITLYENPGRASDGVHSVYTYCVGDTEYLLETAQGPPQECFYNILRTVCDASDIDSLVNHLGRGTMKPTDLHLMAPYLRRLGVEISLTLGGTPTEYGCGTPIRVMYHDAHWAIVRSETRRQAPTPEARRFFTYDFETVANVPYMFSTWDPDIKSRVVYTRTPGCPDFENRVRGLLADYEARGYTAVGFNSNSYDDLYLIRMLDLRRVRAVKGTGNSIIRMTYQRMDFVDACRFLKCSLADACRMLQIENPKLHQDHDAIAEAYTECGSVHVTSDMIKYCARDTESLWYVWQKAKAMFREVFELDPDACISISQMVYQKFKGINPRAPQLTDPIWRRYIIGGKCHGLKGRHTGTIYVYDVNSLYPYVMMTQRFVTSGTKWERTQKVIWHGLYRVKIISGPKYCIIPRRGDVLDWSADSDYEAWCSGIDIEEHIRYGGTLEVLEGWHYADATFGCSMFEFLRDYHNIKQANEGPMRALAKLLMNSLSGKLTQQKIEEETVLSAGEPIPGLSGVYLGEHLWMNTRAKARPTVTGSLINGILIYSYARRHLHQYMYQCADCLYCDTDSIFTRSQLKSGSELGEMKLEAVGATLLVGGKKMYTLLDAEGKVIKAALKGARMEGFYGQDTEISSSDEWLVRAMEEGRSQFVAHMTQCDRRGMSPVFKTMTKVFTLDV